jgi:Arc/MetJ-type ribon-helix-helix transcriptional regulator
MTEQGNPEGEKPADFITAVRDAVSRALKNRENVVMVRVSDEALRNLDMLVDAGITKSRSESAAFLVNEGIRASSQLFERIEKIIDQITALRQQLSAIVAEETDLDIPNEMKEGGNDD